ARAGPPGEDLDFAGVAAVVSVVVTARGDPDEGRCQHRRERTPPALAHGVLLVCVARVVSGEACRQARLPRAVATRRHPWSCAEHTQQSTCFRAYPVMMRNVYNLGRVVASVGFLAMSRSARADGGSGPELRPSLLARRVTAGRPGPLTAARPSAPTCPDFRPE